MPKILLVEDNEASADALARRLERRNYSVRIAADGLQAVALAKSEQPDLILMDLGLPGIDGWDATAHLKSNPETSHIPIIVLSAHAMPNHKHQAFAAGGDDFDSKPVQFDRLLHKIETLLTTRSGDPTSASVSGT
ncbi:MAG TPA: response regulator [Vicinamibacterales bacterium]|nr:response regulator [Vicinamibacterales bacterium]